MASVRANQITQQMSALGELAWTAVHGGRRKSLPADRNVFRSSDLPIVRFL
jgi:hypothetical protein